MSGENHTRVAHILPRFPYFGGRTVVGGYASAALSLANAQKHCGYRPTLVSYVSPKTPAHTSEGIPVHRLGYFSEGSSRLAPFRFLIMSVLWVRRNRRMIDSVHLHAGHVEYIIAARICAAVSGLPVAVTIYCPPSSSGARAWLQRLVCWRPGAKLKLSGMTDNVASELTRVCGGSRPAMTLFPPLDLHFWNPGDNGEPGVEALRFIFVGNLTRTKGIDLFIEALGALKQSGDIPFSATITTELKRTAPDVRSRQLAKRIEELGLLPHVRQLSIVDDMRTLLCRHDVHVAPFRSTDGPSDLFMSSLEAMACGLAVIATRLPGMSQVVRDGIDGLLVEPDDVQSLTEAMRRLATDSQVRSDLGKAARSRALELFDPEQIVEKAEALYGS